MIRFINCVRKRADILREKSHTDLVASDLMRERRAFGESFDGVLKHWWEDASQLHSVLSSEQCDVLMQSMLDFQRQFVDLKRSCVLFTEAQ